MTAATTTLDAPISQSTMSWRTSPAASDFLLDVTPVNGVEARDEFLAGAAEMPEFLYRELGDEPPITRTRLAGVDVASVAGRHGRAPAAGEGAGAAPAARDAERPHQPCSAH